MKVERKADHAVSDHSCKSATGKSLMEWYRALDAHGGVALGRRALSHWLMSDQKVEAWWSATICAEYEIVRGDLARDGKPKGYSICPTKTINTSAKACFEAFATDTALNAWFGPGHDIDLRAGGHWRNADGNRAAINKVNVGRNIRLVAEDEGLTWPTPVEIKFESPKSAKGDRCTVMISIERLQTRAEADGYRRAWGEALKRLKAYLESR
jgi:uncharacterized protein YndB with AHSA1/START domain